MTLAIFDLDNTLLNGDSDHAWGEFLISQNLVDSDDYRQKNDAFYEDYLAGELDIYAYQDFVLGHISQFTPEHLQELLKQFLNDVLENMIAVRAEALIESHKAQGHYPMIITATNEVITQGIAHRLGIHTLIATQAERNSLGHPNGKTLGVASYAQGKITRLQSWLEEHPEHSLKGSYFYSDSHNDIPLLQKVDKPYAVDPDLQLKKFAEKAQWPIISLRA